MSPEVSRVGAAAVILAAGAASRFGAIKVLAPLHGKPLLQHVIDIAEAAGLVDGDVVVVGAAAEEIATRIRLTAGRLIVNPEPGAGLSGSVRLGLAALGDEVEAAVILLADQPAIRSDVIEQLVAASTQTDLPIVVPRYAGGGGPNPVLIRRSAWPLAVTLAGDHGFGPLIAGRGDLVQFVAVEGENPDVDTPADLAALERGPA